MLNQLRDLQYRVAYDDDSMYVIDHSRFITNDIDDIRKWVLLRDTTIGKHISWEEMNFVSFYYQRIGDKLKKKKHS